MSSKTKVLVIGASYFLVPLIQKVRDLGYTACATSYLKDDPGLKVADRAFDVSILDFDRLEALCWDEHIAGVVTCASDLGTLAVGRLNDRMGFDGLTEEQIRCVSHKGRFAELQEKLDLPRAQSIGVKNRDELDGALARMPAYPVVMKPFFGSGSRGLRIAERADQVRANHDLVLDASFLEKGYVVQTFVEGVEHGGECLVEHGKVVFLELTNKFLNDGCVPVGHCIPCDCGGVKDALREQIEKIVASLNVRHSAINIDVIFGPDNVPVIIDFSFRLGGNLLPQLMREKYGFDPFERVVGHCVLHEAVPEFHVREAPGYFGAITLGSPVDGVLTEAMRDGLTSLFHGAARVIDLVFDVSPGEPVKAFSQASNRFGHVLLGVDSLDAYQDILASYQAMMIEYSGPAVRET